MKIKSIILPLFAVLFAGSPAFAHEEKKAKELYEISQRNYEKCWKQLQRYLSGEDQPIFDLNVAEERSRCNAIKQHPNGKYNLHHDCHFHHSEKSCSRYHPNGYVPVQKSEPSQDAVAIDKCYKQLDKLIDERLKKVLNNEIVSSFEANEIAKQRKKCEAINQKTSPKKPLVWQLK